MYADDCALVSHTAEGLQQSANLFAAACERFGLTISIKKTEVMLQPAAKTSRVEPRIAINGSVLKVVNQFTYLGSILTDDCTLDREIEARIRKASVAYGRLRDRVWQEHDIRLETKIALYRAIVLSTLLYGCETWTCYRKHIRALDSFHHRHLRFILRVKWQDMIPNTEILSRCGMTGIEAFIIRHRLRWAGHVMRMGDDRLPKKIFLSELASGKRNVGRPLLRYKDTVTKALKDCDIPPEALYKQSKHHDETTDEVQKPNQWRALIHKGTDHFEQKRIEFEKAKRAKRKEREQRSTTNQSARSAPPNHPQQTQTMNASEFVCDECKSRGAKKFEFSSAKGLQSHRTWKH